MLKVFTPASELADRTAGVITQFQTDFPQFAFDTTLLQPASEFVTRGKLFRGSLCLTVAQALMDKAQAPAAVWSAAIALELAGSAILIQDDVMDQAELRRDLPALHKQYMRSFPVSNLVEAKLFGESMAVCVSDVLFFLATKALTQAECSAEIRLALLQAMSQEIATLALNQAEEARFAALPLSDASVTEAEILKIMIGKTARYTAQWPLQFAAILAGVDLTTQKSLQACGEAIGLVFQLSDDRLGLFGDPAKTGKDSDSDARAGKKTLYALYAHQKLQGVEAVTFHKFYGKSDLNQAELRELQQLLKETGVVGAVDQVTTKYVTQAKQAVQKLSAWPKLQTLLTETVEFLATRER